MMAERGIEVDHSTLNRWVTFYSPQLEKAGFFAPNIYSFTVASLQPVNMEIRDSNKIRVIFLNMIFLLIFRVFEHSKRAYSSEVV